jgi:hypothetical protein
MPRQSHIDSGRITQQCGPALHAKLLGGKQNLETLMNPTSAQPPFVGRMRRMDRIAAGS